MENIHVTTGKLTAHPDKGVHIEPTDWHEGADHLVKKENREKRKPLNQVGDADAIGKAHAGEMPTGNGTDPIVGNK